MKFLEDAVDIILVALPVVFFYLSIRTLESKRRLGAIEQIVLEWLLYLAGILAVTYLSAPAVLPFSSQIALGTAECILLATSLVIISWAYTISDASRTRQPVWVVKDYTDDWLVVMNFLSQPSSIFSN